MLWIFSSPYRYDFSTFNVLNNKKKYKYLKPFIRMRTLITPNKTIRYIRDFIRFIILTKLAFVSINIL